MEAKIIDDEDEWIGVEITDNEGKKHQVAVAFDGRIQGHSSDSYPDLVADRTEEGNERVNQARRFAKYYVYLQRGYDTVPAPENPVRIDAVRRAIARMDSETFEANFSDLYQQLNYERGDETEPAFDVPAEATDPCVFCMDVHLGIDPLETELGEQLAEEFDISEESAADVELTDVSEAKASEWQDFSAEFAAQSLEESIELEEAVYVEETSEVYVKYPDGPDVAVIDDHLEPRAREPDTRIELLPIDPEDPAYFQSFLDHYLRCQIRDSFVEMGVTPPEPYQVLGMGRFMPLVGYEKVDFYPEFHNPETDADAFAPL